MIKTSSATILCAALLGCNPVVPPPSNADSLTTLSGFFDCVREHDGALISAHRGGPSDGFAENSLAAFQNTVKDGLALLEVDVRTSADGVLFLLHDDTLDRTTNAAGKAEKLNWSALQNVELIDENGNNTKTGIPGLEQALKWARAENAVLQLDIKGQTKISDLVKTVQNLNMDQRVMIITYSQEQAIEAARLAPNIALSISINEMADFYNLVSNGVDPKQIIAWTGTREVKPELYKSLEKQGVESIYGAIGGLDARAAQDPSGKPYQALVQSGVHIIATDRAKAARHAINADDRAEAACALPNVN